MYSFMSSMYLFIVLDTNLGLVEIKNYEIIISYFFKNYLISTKNTSQNMQRFYHRHTSWHLEDDDTNLNFEAHFLGECKVLFSLRLSLWFSILLYLLQIIIIFAF